MNEIAALLRDFGQGASNAAASNVSGPVDLLAWALRKGGVPVPSNPILGSEWMRQKGLLADPRNKIAGLLGEAAGLSAPIAAAAKAPQIARGLLRADDAMTAGANRMADHFERTGAAFKGPPNQRGAIVWHGSPHKFDRFDSSKIGTGEGAQAYGHGLYLADSPGVAKSYQQKLATNEVTFRGSQYKPNRSALDAQSMGLNALSIEPGPREAAAKLRAAAADDSLWIGYGASDKSLRSKYADAADWLDKNAADITVNNGSLYKVDLPDEKIARMLDWDKPLSQQAENVRAAFHVDKFPDARIKDLKGYEAYVKTGQSLGEPFSGSRKAAEFLRNKGIPGIRYLDGGSRGAGAGTSNYVIFPQEEAALTILERNGSPINALVQALKGPR